MTDPRDTDAALLAQSGRRAEAAGLARPVRQPVDPIQEAMGCPTPVWLNDRGSKDSDGRCVAYSGPHRCPAGATHWAWIGCTTGEHIDRSAVCGRHSVAMVTTLPPLNCVRCWNALRIVSKAKIIKIEAIRGDDEDTSPTAMAHPDLLP